MFSERAIDAGTELHIYTAECRPSMVQSIEWGKTTRITELLDEQQKRAAFFLLLCFNSTVLVSRTTGSVKPKHLMHSSLYWSTSIRGYVCWKCSTSKLTGFSWAILTGFSFQNTMEWLQNLSHFLLQYSFVITEGSYHKGRKKIFRSITCCYFAKLIII